MGIIKFLDDTRRIKGVSTNRYIVDMETDIKMLCEVMFKIFKIMFGERRSNSSR